MKTALNRSIPSQIRPVLQGIYSSLARIAALLFVATLIGCLLPLSLHAQETEQNQNAFDVWSPPRNISQTRTSISRYPDLTVDRTGRLHLTWVEHTKIEEQGLKDVEHGADYTVQESLLMYTTLGDDGWTAPFDLAYNPTSDFLIPTVASDAAGRVHIIYWDNGAHFHIASQPLAASDSAALWSGPVNITEQIEGIQNRFPNLLVDEENTLHLAYVENSDERQSDGNAGGIRYTLSNDAGANWGFSTFIDDYPGWPILGANSYDSNFARSADGTLHFISMDGDEAIYIQSEPSGVITRRELVETDPERRPYASGWVFLEDEKIHLLWGAQSGKLFHKWSSDGGATWSGVNELAAQDMKRYGGIGVATDSLGRLVVAYSDLGDIWSQIWDGSRWSGAANLTNSPDQYDLWPRVVVANGNEAHLVWYAGFPEVFLYDAVSRMARGEYEILYATAHLDAPRIEPQRYAAAPLPAPASTISTTASEAGATEIPSNGEIQSQTNEAQTVQVTTSPQQSAPNDDGPSDDRVSAAVPPSTTIISTPEPLGQLQRVTASPQGILVMSTGLVFLLLSVVIGFSSLRR